LEALYKKGGLRQRRYDSFNKLYWTCPKNIETVLRNCDVFENCYDSYYKGQDKADIPFLHDMLWWLFAARQMLNNEKSNLYFTSGSVEALVDRIDLLFYYAISTLYDMEPYYDNPDSDAPVHPGAILDDLKKMSPDEAIPDKLDIYREKLKKLLIGKVRVWQDSEFLEELNSKISLDDGNKSSALESAVSDLIAVGNADDTTTNRLTQVVAEDFFLPRYAFAEVRKLLPERKQTNLLLFQWFAAACVAGGATWLVLAGAVYSCLPIIAAFVLIVVSINCMGNEENRGFAILLWTLRIIPSVAVGSIVLMAIPGWGETIRDNAGYGVNHADILKLILVFIGLLAGAYSYLMIEAYGHKVRGVRVLFGRSMKVLGLTLIYSIGVNTLLFVTVFAYFTERVSNMAFSESFTQMDSFERLFVLLLASAFCTVIGMFTQVVWDDAAITSPILHKKWRS
jgi:hypothetical protein